MVLAVEMNSRLFLTSRITVDVLHPIIAAISRKLLWNAKPFSITHLLVKLRCWNFMVPLFRHFGHLNYTTFHAELIATFFRFFGRLCKGYRNISFRFFCIYFCIWPMTCVSQVEFNTLKPKIQDGKDGKAQPPHHFIEIWAYLPINQQRFV